MTRKQFTDSVRERHGDRYTFVRTPRNVSDNGTTTVTCPEHGDIVVNTLDFIAHGCRRCVATDYKRKWRDKNKRDYYEREREQSKAENHGKRPTDVMEHKASRDEPLNR